MSCGSFLSVDVLCPFFRRDENYQKITCEGLVDKSTLTLSFGRRKDFNIHIMTYCCKHYDKCEIHRMLMESKYEDD